MYEPKWPFLLIYGSHDMRQVFLQVDELSTGPPGFGASQSHHGLHKPRHFYVLSLLGTMFGHN